MDYTKLIERLRETASEGVSVWGDLQIEAADAIEAMQARAEPVKFTKRQIENIYCADTDAKDWHMPHDNYAAGLRMGLKLAAAKGVAL